MEQSNKRKLSVNSNCIYIGVKFSLHGYYMFLLVASHFKAKELNDSSNSFTYKMGSAVQLFG
jgi:hypothetical protein